jgi:maltose O-acetyltransferase
MSEHKRRMVRGELYRADDEELVADRLRCQVLVEQFNATSADDQGIRQKLLHDILGHIGADSTILPRLECDYGFQIRIGSRTFIDRGAVILDSAAVTIGDDVQIGPSVHLLTAIHPLEASARRRGYVSAQPVRIGFGAWLEGGVIVCPGVTVGDGSVVGAGSVVTQDLPPRVLAYGNPARVIRDI